MIMNIAKIMTISLIMTGILTIGIVSNPTLVFSQGSNSVTITLGAADEGNFEPFSPNAIDVVQGSTVSWTNQDSVPHTVTAGGTGEPLFDSGPIPPGMTWDNTFDSSGTFGYHCSIHPWMMGRVMVG
jgi:plastocyanin